MAIKIASSLLYFVSLTSSACYAHENEKRPYTSVEYLKNYALSSCLADGYQAKEIISDATAAANGYKELGSLDIDAYNETAILGRQFLAKKYVSQSGKKLILMKCMDFYHSEELNQVARKYANKK